MTEQRVVLVTGAGGAWGARLAAELVANTPLHVIGLDAEPPTEEIKGLDFVQADVRNPLMTEFLKEEGVDTVCHLAFEECARPTEASFDLNVIGTMKVLGACAEAGVRKAVLRSSTMVYGANPLNSAFLPEDHPLRAGRESGYLRDWLEIESFCNGLRAQAPALQLTTLRLAHVVGPKADTPMTRFLRDENAVVLFGFDPMMQVIHEEDAVRALAHAVVNDGPGTFNVAAEGLIPLWKLMGLASKVPVPVFHPLAYIGAALMGPRVAPLDLDYLRYPCVADLSLMRAALGFVPRYTAEEALREFAAQQRIRQYLPESAVRAYDQDRFRDTMERRRRARQAALAATETALAPVEAESADAGARPRASRKAARNGRTRSASHVRIVEPAPAPEANGVEGVGPAESEEAIHGG